LIKKVASNIKKMCYHNSINTDKQHLERKYNKKLREQKTLFEPVFHASGFEYCHWPVVINASETIEMFNWGLIPSWTKTITDANSIKALTLNARIETIEEKPSFKNAKRCIVASSGFFEWQTLGKQKIPYFISLKNKTIFSLSGLYDTWTNEKGEIVNGFSIVTTTANPLMERIHNIKKRMPVILNTEMESAWLDGTRKITDFHEPFHENLMQAHTIGNIILSKKHNVSDVTKPQTILVQEQLGLF
jgi:putative SOS response-associated peptidase YedK